MAQFGVKMNFLCILQVSRFVFVLKMNFYKYFSVFKHLWTGPRILESAGVSAQEILGTVNSNTWTTGLFLKTAGALLQKIHGEGVPASTGHPIRK